MSGCSAVRASVIYANDELFAERENLIKPEDPVFQPHTFGSDREARSTHCLRSVFMIPSC